MNDLNSYIDNIAKQKKSTIEAVYKYANSDGASLYYKLRLKCQKTGGKSFSFFHITSDGQFAAKQPSLALYPLYNLPFLKNLNEKTGTIWLVEGEKCADALNGFIAKQNAVHEHLAMTSGGANSCKNADWNVLQGRKVVIWADNDNHGQKYAFNVVDILQKKGVRTECIDLAQLNLGEGQDVVDWLEKHSNATIADLLALTKTLVNLNTAQIAPPSTNKAKKLETINLADVKAEPILWLWRGVIPLGGITLLSGDPGVGKSQLCATISAHVTTGHPWVDGQSMEYVGEVLIVTYEDDPSSVIKPRLIATEAHIENCHFYQNIANTQENCSEMLNFADISHVSSLDEKLQENPRIRLIIIDPLAGYMGSTRTHENAATRAVLERLAAIAQQRDVAILCVSHNNKNENMRPLYRSNGSIAFTGIARAVLSLEKDEQDPSYRYLSLIKSNYGVDLKSFCFIVEPTVVEVDSITIDTSRIKWVKRQKPEPVKNEKQIERAMALLRQQFEQTSELPAALLIEKAKKANISEASLQRGREQLGIITCKKTNGWYWQALISHHRED